MNAQTPVWQRYLPQIDGMLPGQSDEARELRARVMTMRDQATNVRRDKEPDWAGEQLLGTIEELGTTYATADISSADLQTLRTCMAELFRIAATLQVIGRSS